MQSSLPTDAALDAALTLALALPDERALALLRRQRVEAPDRAPESAPELGTALRDRLVAIRASDAIAAERQRCAQLGVCLLYTSPSPRDS